MNTQANEKQPEFQFLGDKLRINFDEVVETKTDEEGNEITTYKYLTACVNKSSTLNERIEAIIHTKYPTYGAELAARNGTVLEAFEYNKHVSLAKYLAKKSLGFDVGVFDYVPKSISLRQAKQQLMIDGLYDSVELAINNITDPVEKRIVENYWHNAQIFERDSDILVNLSLALSLDESKIDELFYNAAQL